MTDLSPAVLAALRALVGDDWDRGVSSTDIGTREDTLATAEQVVAAVRPVILAEAAVERLEADPVGLAEYQAEAREWAELDVEVKDE